MGAKVYIVVTPFFPSPDNWRGAYCFDFVKALKHARQKLRVEVFVPGKGSDYEMEGVTVHRFKTKQLPSNILPFLFRRYNEKSFLRAVAQAGIKIEDVMFCHGHTANFAIYPLALKRANPSCKTLLHHHDLMSFGLNLGRLRHFAPYNLLLSRQLKKLHEQIDLHVFISRLCEKSFRSFPDVDWLEDADYSAQARGLVGNIAPVIIKDSYVLHNGVDTEIFKPRNTPKTRKEFVVGCVGNFSPEKGQYDLLSAVKLINDGRVEHVESADRIKIIFVGSGPDKKRCEEFAKVSGIDAEFRAEVGHEKLAEFYQELDLFVLSTWLDGFGCVYTEAYACGVPFIATTRAGVEELIPNSERHLWLADPRNPEMLREKIRHYMEHRQIQNLNGEIEINNLVGAFLDRLSI